MSETDYRDPILGAQVEITPNDGTILCWGGPPQPKPTIDKPFALFVGFSDYDYDMDDCGVNAYKGAFETVQDARRCFHANYDLGRHGLWGQIALIMPEGLIKQWEFRESSGWVKCDLDEEV